MLGPCTLPYLRGCRQLLEPPSSGVLWGESLEEFPSSRAQEPLSCFHHFGHSAKNEAETTLQVGELPSCTQAARLPMCSLKLSSRWRASSLKQGRGTRSSFFLQTYIPCSPPKAFVACAVHICLVSAVLQRQCFAWAATTTQCCPHSCRWSSRTVA